MSSFSSLLGCTFGWNTATVRTQWGKFLAAICHRYSLQTARVARFDRVVCVSCCVKFVPNLIGGAQSILNMFKAERKAIKQADKAWDKFDWM